MRKDLHERFAGIDRLYGAGAVARLAQARDWGRGVRFEVEYFGEPAEADCWALYLKRVATTLGIREPQQ